MNDIRENLRRIAAEQSRDRLALIGAGVSALWLLLVLLFWLFGPVGDGESSGLARLMSFVGIVLPLVLIWCAVGFGRSLASLQAEAAELRGALAQMRNPGGAGPGDDIPPMPSQLGGTGYAAASSGPATAGQASRSTPRPAAAPSSPAASTVSDQAEEPPLDLSEIELISAINFPDGPDDHEAVLAMRKALADPELARMIRAAQDVVTLLAKRGVYMDELYAKDADAATWRRFTTGARGASVARLELDVDRPALDTTSEMLRSDEVFRDVAQHFLRRFDGLLSRAAPELDDRLLVAMAYTRSGRAFTLLAQVTGMIGSYIPEEAQSA